MYEQSLPSLSMTALAAALKWIRIKTRDNKSAEQEMYFLLARAVLLGMHVCFQIGPHGTCTWAAKHNII